MNPLSLTARSYRTFEELPEIHFPEGCIAITGPMGSGKSSIVEGIELALYGDCRTGPLAENLGIGFDDRLEIALIFERAGELYRARRGYSAKGRGKPTLDLERLEEHMAYDPGRGDSEPDEYPAVAWMPLTRESIRATQSAIEELVGLSHDSFRASCFIAQKDASAFTNATPAEAKAILAEVMRLQSWDRLRDVNREAKRQAERELAELAGRIALLEETGGDVDELRRARDHAGESVENVVEAHAVAENELGAAAENVTALEQAEATYRERTSYVHSAEARLRERTAVIDRATIAKLEAVEVQRELSEAGFPGARLAELEERRAAADRQRELRRDREAERDRLAADAEDARRQAVRLSEERETLSGTLTVLVGKAAALNDPANVHTCDRCGQALHGEAHMTALERIREERDEAERRVAGYGARIDEIAGKVQVWQSAADAVEIPASPDADAYDALVDEIRTARAAELEQAGRQAKLCALEATVAEVTPELTAEVARLAAELVSTQGALAEIDEPEPGALDAARVAAVTAKASLDIVAHRLTESRAALIRAEAALEQAAKIAAELEVGRLRRDALQDELDLLALLERAYGRDGIPALIVERHAIPAIEMEANRILAAFGESNRVELRTQAERKSGDGLKDGLWITVITPEGERGHKTFSGGERACLDFALRVGLARLLRHRGAADISFLVVDEVEGLDENHQAAFIEIVLSLRDEFSKIMISSHYSGLRDAPLDALIEVVNEDGRSRIVDQTIEVVKDGNRSVAAAA